MYLAGRRFPLPRMDLSKNFRVLLLMLAGLLLATALLYLLLQVPAVERLNTDLFLWINQFYWPPLAVLTAVLELPDVLYYGAVIMVILVYFERHDLALCILIAMVISSLYVFVVKDLTAVPRPYDVLNGIHYAYSPGSYAFPSGHAAGAFAAFTAWCFRERRHYIPLLGFATLIAISRVYIGVHYPMDVIAGAVIGLIIGYSVARLDLTAQMKWFSDRYQRTRSRLGMAKT